MLTLVRQRALRYKAEYFLCIIAVCLGVLFTLNFFTLKLLIITILCKQKFVCFLLFGIIYQHFTFCKRLPVLAAFCC